MGGWEGKERRVRGGKGKDERKERRIREGKRKKERKEMRREKK